ncbi:MAG: CARDB domain-containing protein, partial [Candidatus Poseidoniaceae archaeon]
MGGALKSRVLTLLVLGLMIGFSQIPLLQHQSEFNDDPMIQRSGSDPGVTDLPSWRVGDKWIYSGTFDPSILITNTGVSASVGEIRGDATAEVTEILQLQFDNGTEWVYKLRMSADFDKSGVELEGYTGNAEIQFTQTEYLRVSDFATVKNDLDLYIKFIPYGIGSLTQILGDITITNEYSPATEAYDFPLRYGERWTSLTTASSQWSGQSDYITPFPPPETDTNTTTWEVTKVGQPRNSIGAGIAYSGCDSSYELTSWNSDGVSTGYRWYCPAVNNYAWRHAEEDVGLTIDFRLKQYMPVGATGVESNSDPGTRPTCVDVAPERSLTALDSPLNVWVHLSPSCYGTIDGVGIEVAYDGTSTTIYTASNGSASTSIDSGRSIDYSSTNTDWSSNGIMAKSGSYVGAATITLDEYLVGLDLIADEERAVVIRNRSGVVSTVSSLSGYNVLPGDNLTIEVAVVNKGITPSTLTDLRIYHPDGSIFDLPLPSLSTYESHKVDFTWTVPADAAIGTIPIRWESDPLQVNTADA